MDLASLEWQTPSVACSTCQRHVQAISDTNRLEWRIIDRAGKRAGKHKKFAARVRGNECAQFVSPLFLRFICPSLPTLNAQHPLSYEMLEGTVAVKKSGENLHSAAAASMVAQHSRAAVMEMFFSHNCHSAAAYND